MKEIIIKVRFDELPNPVREDFLLESKDGVIIRKELSKTLKESFVDPKSLTYAFFLGELYK